MDSFHKNLAATSKKQSINQKHTTQRLQGLLQQLKSKREQVAQGKKGLFVSYVMNEEREQATKTSSEGLLKLSGPRAGFVFICGR